MPTEEEELYAQIEELKKKAEELKKKAKDMEEQNKDTEFNKQRNLIVQIYNLKDIYKKKMYKLENKKKEKKEIDIILRLMTYRQKC